MALGRFRGHSGAYARLMRAVSLTAGSQPFSRVLAIGAHADDIEIGCGGTLLSLTRSLPELEVWWVVLSANAERESEARESADVFLAAAPGARVEVHSFRDGFLPFVGAEVKDVFEALKERVVPDVVFTHSRDDAHQDHRLACELTWNTFRDQLILEYEVPKWDGDLGCPNVFFPLTRSVAAEKVSLLARHFPSQAGKNWFDADVFTGLMRLRGLEANAPERYAEAFAARKLSLVV